jgi:hypothetical protein
MSRKVALVALGLVMLAGCGTAPQAQRLAGNVALAKKEAEDKLNAEAYGLINRWMLDRNYVVTSVAQYKSGGRQAPKNAVRGILWATYRTKRGFLFKDGYWNLSLRDESDPNAMGRGYTGRGRYGSGFSPSYTAYSGAALGFYEDIDESFDAEYDDYDEEYTGDCDDQGPNYGNNGYGGFGSSAFGYTASGRRRRPSTGWGGGYDDGLDCYPGGGTGFGNPNYGGTPGYGSGDPYRSPYNSYNGTQVTLVRIQDNWKSKNFKMFNGQPAMAFIDSQKVKEVRLSRDGSAIWKSIF